MNKSNQSKYANLNLNAAVTKQNGAPVSGGTAPVTKSGLLLLSKRPRAAAGVKLSVPKPVNLPSIKKEHAGNDPTTQLVPASGGSGTWTKPDEPGSAGTGGQSTITAASTWASQHAAPVASAGSQQRGPSPHAAERLSALNPDEYPSLAASAKAEAAAAAASKLGKLPTQDYRSWADDERAPPGGGGGWRSGPGASADWNHRADDERYVGDRPDYRSWDDRPARYDPYDERGGFHRRYDDDAREDGGRRMDQGPRSHHGPDGPPPPPPPRRYGYEGSGGYGGFDPYEDRGLFPPPPPPRATLPAEAEEEDDPERRAFEAELQRVAAELERRKNDERGDSRAGSRSGSVAEKRELVSDRPGNEGDDAASRADSVAASDSETHGPSAPGQRGQSRFRADEDEEVRRRRDRATEKLRKLELQMAARATGPTPAADAEVSADVPKPPAWKKLPKEEDLAWDDERRLQGRRDEAELDPKPGHAKSALPASKAPGTQRTALASLQQQEPTPMPQPAQIASASADPPPPQQEPSAAWHHQRPPLAPASQERQLPPPPSQAQLQSQQTPPVPITQPPVSLAVHHNHHQPRMGHTAVAGGSAIFGSFDDDLFEELSKTSMPPLQPDLQAAGPKQAWAPPEGTASAMPKHGPLMQQQHQAQPHNRQQQAAGQADSIDRAGSWRQDANSSRRPGSGPDRGNSNSRSQRLGRPGSASESDGTDLPGAPGGRGSRGGRGGASARGGRGGRGRGGNSSGGELEGDGYVADSWGVGEQRWGGSRSTRGQRGPARSMVLPSHEDSDGDAGRRGSKGQQVGLQNVLTQNGLQPTSTAIAPAPELSLQAVDGLRQPSDPPRPAAEGSITSAAGPSAVLGASSAPGRLAAPGAGSWIGTGTVLPPSDPSPALPAVAPSITQVVSPPGLSLNDPVLTSPVPSRAAAGAAAVGSSAPLDPAPGAGAKPIGFDRQVGPKPGKSSPVSTSVAAASALPAAHLVTPEVLAPTSAELLVIGPSSGKAVSSSSGADALGNGILALPADLTLDMVPSPQKQLQTQRPQQHQPSQQQQHAVPGYRSPSAPPTSSMQGSMQGRSIGGPFAFGPGSAGPIPGSSTGAVPPPGIAAMWEHGKHGQAVAAPASGPAMAWPSMFQGSGAQVVSGTSNGPVSPQSTQLFGSHFGGFNAPPPPQRYVGQQAPFGGLGASTGWQSHQQGAQPFLPSNKPPDWSIGPQSPTLGTLGGLGTSFSVGTEGQQLLPGTVSSTGHIGTGFSGALSTPMGSSATPLGSFSMSASQPQQQQQQQLRHGQNHGAGRPGPPFVPNQHQQHQHQHAQAAVSRQQPRGLPPGPPPMTVPPPPPPAPSGNAAAAAVANLPDDIFDPRPGVGPAANGGMRPPGPPSQPPPHTGRLAVPTDRAPSRGSGGRGGRGRGRIGPVGAEVEPRHDGLGVGADAALHAPRDGGGPGGRDGAGRGFAGRNGRGAGRANAVVAASTAPAAVVPGAHQASLVAGPVSAGPASMIAPAITTAANVPQTRVEVSGASMPEGLGVDGRGRAGRGGRGGGRAGNRSGPPGARGPSHKTPASGGRTAPLQSQVV